MRQIADWLDGLGLGQYAQCFAENDIDFTILCDLTDQDLEKIGVRSLGHRRKLLRAIADLKEVEKSPPGVAIPAAAPDWLRPPDAAERRQVTVMFSDLVGSTALSVRMDPEDLREVISAYQKCVAETVQRYDGFVARYMGDGVLVHFGYPRAHEDDAERAVRAGLELVTAVAALKSRTPLQTRIGIATGLVVIGELIGSGAAQERAIVGETPNLAARLQGLAEPNMVVIADSTRRLLGNLFELEDLGRKDLHGIAGPTRVWAALRASSAEGRFEAMHATDLTALVGREEEFELLLRRWSKAKTGEGQAVLLSGEAGIGKSRLTVALLERLAGEPHSRLRYFCAPHHMHSPLHPFIVQLERAASFEPGSSASVKLDKLEALLKPTARNAPRDLALIADLMSVPTDGRYPALEVSPQQKREMTLAALLDQLDGVAANSPVLIVFEDLHWIDPTSLDLLDRTIARVANLPVLLVITLRPEFQPAWVGQPHVTMLPLSRLGRRYSAGILEGVTKGKALPDAVVEQILAQTDGVPLFIEELTSTLLESGLLRETTDRYVLDGPLPPLAVPTTLQASLVARLDRLASVKDVAQIGAAIGREFSHELIGAVAFLAPGDLDAALERLTLSGLISRRGTPPVATYSFKHALVQDAAYATLLKSRRRQLHASIAKVLVERFPATAETLPEDVARHFTEAGLASEAIAYWCRAGRRSAANSAMAEATAQVNKGLDILDALPDDHERWRLQVELLAILGEVLIATKGQAAPETGEAYARARELWSKLGETPHLSAVLYGQFTNCLLRAQMAAAAEIAAEFLRRAREQKDSAAERVALRCVGVSELHLGRPMIACDPLERSIALDESSLHHSLSYVSPANLRVSALAYLGMSQVLSGRREDALASVRQALDEAQRLARPLAWAATLGITWRVQCLARDTATLAGQAQALTSVATEQRFPYYLSLGKLYSGYALAAGGQAEEGAARMRDGLANFRATDTRWMIPFFLMLLADACAAAGRAQEALGHLEEAAGTAERTNERWCEAEIVRSKGELLLALGDQEGAQNCFQQALALARDQGARLWELRAARSCARLWSGCGRREQARELLAPVLGSFVQGFDAPELQEANALLDELGR